jgi:hypothetical protein
MGIIVGCKWGYWWLGIYGRHPHNIFKIDLGKKNNHFVVECQYLMCKSKVKNYQFFTKLTLKAKTSSYNTSTQQEHEMWKTNVKIDLYYVKICKHEHVKNMTRLWCKIMPKTSVEQTKGNERSYSYLYPFGDLV